jgi:acyl-CoA synthetase (AMP-forming)/AMP-acid ligase II
LNLQALSVLVTAQAGGCAIVMDRRDAAGIAEWIQREKATFWNGAPAQFHDLATRTDLDLSTLTEVWTGGADCPEYIRDAFAARHGVPLTATYGLSEAPTVVALDPVNGGLGGDAHRRGSSGQVLPHLTVAAYGDDGQRLEAGSTGELRLSAATAGPFADLWRPPLGRWDGGVLRAGGDENVAENMVATGDIGHVDADGWLTVVDRKKLLIVRGSANVYPAEIEAVLNAHPAVATAVVFGLADDRLGERIAALVVPAGGRSDAAPLDGAALASFCAERLARYKIPEVWGQAAELPRNSMNKILRSDLPALLRSAQPL